MGRKCLLLHFYTLTFLLSIMFLSFPCCFSSSFFFFNCFSFPWLKPCLLSLFVYVSHPLSLSFPFLIFCFHLHFPLLSAYQQILVAVFFCLSFSTNALVLLISIPLCSYIIWFTLDLLSLRLFEVLRSPFFTQALPFLFSASRMPLFHLVVSVHQRLFLSVERGDHLWDTRLSFLQPKLVVMLPGAIS